MTKSRLQACVAILQALNKNQLTADRIAASVVISRKSLSHCLSILSEQNMVERIEQHDSITYCITRIGKKVLSFFKLDSIVEYKRARAPSFRK